MASALAQDSGNNGPTWIVPAPVLRNRLGEVFWSRALNAAGMTLPSTLARFTQSDFQEASARFMRAYRHFRSPKEVASYDSWVTAEAAAGRDRPSVIAIRRFFGAWESVIGSAMPPEFEDELAGVVNLLREESAVQERWRGRANWSAKP